MGTIRATHQRKRNTNHMETTVKATPLETAAAAGARELHQQQSGSWRSGAWVSLCRCGRAWRNGLHRDQQVAAAVIAAYRTRALDG